MLRSLSFLMASDEVQLDPTQGAVLLQGLAAAASLTNLYISGRIVHEGLQLCAHLTALSQLQVLAIHVHDADIFTHAPLSSRSDALQLAALTSLTQLHLSSAAGVDDVAGSVLALRLMRLQDLRLADCGLRSAAALLSIATLTGLTQLELSAGDDTLEAASDLLLLGQEDVLLLTPLTQLKLFWSDGFFCDEDVCRLWNTEKGWLQQPPAWLCQVHAAQQHG
jgi:hypothetical protein